MSDEEVTLESLVGEHELSGVSEGQISVPAYEGAGYNEDCNTLSFILDGKTYTVTEDPEDGYRSAMKSIIRGGVVTNTFAPQKVICEYVTGGYRDYTTASEVLVMRDAVTGKDVLAIGTNNTDDYYPYFVANFDPTAMACNQP